MNFLTKTVSATIFSSVIMSTIVADVAFSQTSINGKWLVVHDGAGRENWEILIQNNRISIVAFHQAVEGINLHGDYRRPLSIESITSSQQGINLQVRKDQFTVYQYQIAFINPNQMSGTYRYSDNRLNALGAIAGSEGIITDAGSVLMTRCDAHTPKLC